MAKRRTPAKKIHPAKNAVLGWQLLLEGYPWFSRKRGFPLPAYSEYMPPPRLGRRPYGASDPEIFPLEDPYGWNISEAEEEWELRPGLSQFAEHILSALIKLGRGEPAYAIGGHGGCNLKENPYWPRELAEHAGRIPQERFVVLLPLALSRTQDDLGRIRWTLFGGSEQGPERAFWKSYAFGRDAESAPADVADFFLRLLAEVYEERAASPRDLLALGFRFLPTDSYEPFSYWKPDRLPEGIKSFLVSDPADWEKVRYLFTFRPFTDLPAAVRRRYLAGQLHLIPFPGSLVFWGMPSYRSLATQFPMAMQIPLLHLIPRSGGPDGIRVPQSGWLHEPHPGSEAVVVQKELLAPGYQRTHRWNRMHRYENELALNRRADHMAHVLFDTSLAALGLYDKPMARNCQMWTGDFDLLLDGPHADRPALRRAEAAVVEGGLFGYRFQFPAMRTGRHEVYWHRPLVAYLSRREKKIRVLPDSPLGYLTAYPATAPVLDRPLELRPRLLRRELFLDAVREFGKGDYYTRQTAHNLLSLLDAGELLGRGPLPQSFARHLALLAKDESFETWLDSLPKRSRSPAAGRRMRASLAARISTSPETLPDPITFEATASRGFEEAYWNDIAWLSGGRYQTTDNADIVLDRVTQSHLTHHHRDLEKLGDDLLQRHRAAIAAAGMEGRALCGELSFRWETDFDFPEFGGWCVDNEGHAAERNLLVVIPGSDRNEAVVLADHYDTAYMDDVFDTAHGGSGARLASAGADDNHSATAVLLEAAPVYLRLAKDGLLARDVWLLHLTGEEFPADCLGARSFCRALIERSLQLKLADGKKTDLSAVRVRGIVVMDMIAHNRENARNIFQIAPGRGYESLLIAREANAANRLWNEHAHEWNRRADRIGTGRGTRTRDGRTIPPVARHPSLLGEVRTVDHPLSSLYNTDGQVFSDCGIPVTLLMEDYDIDRSGYHDSRDTMKNIDLDYGSAVAAIAIETVARLAGVRGLT